MTHDPDTGEVTPKKYKVKRRVTLPVYRFMPGTAVAVKIEEPIKASATKGEDDKTVDLLHVTLLETGGHCQIVLGSVLKENLIEAYPDESYVGRLFVIEKSSEKRGKNVGSEYFTYTITEIEEDCE